MTTYGENQRLIKDNVLEILENSEGARNSDKQLLLKYWREYDNIGMDEGFERAFLSNSTSTESIIRARRTIQSGGLYLPTDEEVLRKRRMLQEEARNHHATE